MKNENRGKIYNNYTHYWKGLSSSTSGFSLLELVILLGLLSGTGIGVLPIYRQWLHQHRLDMKTQEFLELLKFARVSAIYQSTDIFVAKDPSIEKARWLVRTRDGHVIRVYSVCYASQYVISSHLNRLPVIRFSAKGTSVGYNGRVILGDSTIKAKQTIFISPTGRIRLEVNQLLN